MLRRLRVFHCLIRYLVLFASVVAYDTVASQRSSGALVEACHHFKSALLVVDLSLSYERIPCWDLRPALWALTRTDKHHECQLHGSLQNP